MLWMPGTTRIVYFSDTDGSFSCQQCQGGHCSVYTESSTLASGLPLTTISIFESSGHEFAISGTPASSRSSQETAGGTRSTLHDATTTTELRGLETTSLLPRLASHTSSQQTSAAISALPLASSSTNQSQTRSNAHSSTSESVKLGLGVSLPIITLSAILATAILWLRRRTRRTQAGRSVPGDQSSVSYRGDRGRPPFELQGNDHTPRELGELGRYSRYGELTAESGTSRQELPASEPNDGRPTRFNTGPWRWLERGSGHR